MPVALVIPRPTRAESKAAAAPVARPFLRGAGEKSISI